MDSFFLGIFPAALLTLEVANPIAPWYMGDVSPGSSWDFFFPSMVQVSVFLESDPYGSFTCRYLASVNADSKEDSIALYPISFTGQCPSPMRPMRK